MEAAAALKITARDLLELGLVDAVVPEPCGGAHNDFDKATSLVDQALMQALTEIADLPAEDRLTRRYDKFRRMGEEGKAFIDTSAPE